MSSWCLIKFTVCSALCTWRMCVCDRDAVSCAVKVHILIVKVLPRFSSTKSTKVTHFNSSWYRNWLTNLDIWHNTWAQVESFHFLKHADATEAGWSWMTLKLTLLDLTSLFPKPPLKGTWQSAVSKFKASGYSCASGQKKKHILPSGGLSLSNGMPSWGLDLNWCRLLENCPVPNYLHSCTVTSTMWGIWTVSRRDLRLSNIPQHSDSPGCPPLL